MYFVLSRVLRDYFLDTIVMNNSQLAEYGTGRLWWTDFVDWMQIRNGDVVFRIDDSSTITVLESYKGD